MSDATTGSGAGRAGGHGRGRTSTRVEVPAAQPRHHGPGRPVPVEPVESELEDFAEQIADQVKSFLLALRAIARGEAGGGEAISLLLLEISQVLLAGGRLGVLADFEPSEQYEPDPGPDPDLDAMRLRLAVLLEGADDYTEVFDPYTDPPELVSSLLSDDLTSIASQLAHGLRHYLSGRIREALWWWQFSYVSTWGAEASAVLRALQSVIAHDRLDADFESEQDQVAEAERLLAAAADPQAAQRG